MHHSTWDVLMCNGEGGYASLELNKKTKTEGPLNFSVVFIIQCLLGKTVLKMVINGVCLQL